MSLVADALQPFIMSGLFTVQGRPSQGSLADLLGSQTKIGYDLSFDETKQMIIADFRDPEPVLHAIASDSARFASASFQSMTAVPLEVVKKEAIAWSLIRAYYAAFYAGHASLRLVGESCSFFDRSHVGYISRLAGAIGKTPRFRVDKGTYHCRLSQSATAVECRSLRGAAGGSHEVFWDMFGLRLRLIAKGVLQGPLPRAEAQLIFAKLDLLHRSISGHGAPFHSWLSIIRNDIQYRHHHDVWLPSRMRKGSREQLGRLAEQWMRDPVDIDIGSLSVRPLGEFVATCAFIVAFCRSLLERIVDRSPEHSQSFAALGPLAYLRSTSSA